MKIDEINYDYYNQPQDNFYDDNDDDFDIIKKKYTKKQRKVFTGIIIFITSLVLIFSVVFNSFSFHNIMTYELKEGSIKETINVSGKVRSANEKFYYSFAPAIVTSLNVKVGDEVKNGDVLATFNSSEVDAYVLQLEYQLSQAKIEYEDVVGKYNAIKGTTTALKSQISTLSKKWDVSTTSYSSFSKPINTLKITNDEIIDDKNDDVIVNENVSDLGIDDDLVLKFEKLSEKTQDEIKTTISNNTDELEDALTSAIAKAEKELEETFADLSETLRQKIHLALLQNQVTTLETQVPTTAQLTELGKAQDIAQQLYDDAKSQSAELKDGWVAHFDGVITEINIKEGSTVSSEKAGIVLSDITQKIIEIDLSEHNSKKVKAGQSALIYVDDKIINGEVSFVSPTATEKDGKNYISCDVILGEDSLDLVVGFDAKVHIITNSVAQTILIPTSSVMTDENGKYCFVYNNFKNTISKKYFKEGLSDDNYFQVLYGVEKKELVVLNPTEDLKDGDRAKVFVEETTTAPVIEKPLYEVTQDNNEFEYTTQTNNENETTENFQEQTEPQTTIVNVSGTTNVNI